MTCRSVEGRGTVSAQIITGYSVSLHEEQQKYLCLSLSGSVLVSTSSVLHARWRQGVRINRSICLFGRIQPIPTVGQTRVAKPGATLHPRHLRPRPCQIPVIQKSLAVSDTLFSSRLLSQVTEKSKAVGLRLPNPGLRCILLIPPMHTQAESPVPVHVGALQTVHLIRHQSTSLSSSNLPLVPATVRTYD